MTTSAEEPTQPPPRAPGPDPTCSPIPDGGFAIDREAAIEPVGPGRWKTRLSSAWNIEANPNGGYALTPLLRAMGTEAGRHPDPISLTTHYLRPAVGDADGELRVEVVRRGRRTSTVRATMIQDGKPRLETIGTFADLSASHARSDFNGFRMEMEPPELAAPEDCADRGALSQGVVLPILSRVEVLIDPRYAEPAGAGVATSAGWIRLQDGRQPDSCTLPLFCDAFPPSLFSLVGRTGRVPTIELTVHVRRRPAEGWIRGCFTSRELAGATLVEDGTLWDSSGEVVAQCRQLALVTD